MEKSGFFNAEQLANGTFDRTYLADSFASYFARFIGNGVFVNPATQLQVIQNTSPDMSIQVLVGNAYINGYWYENTVTEIKPIEVASGTTNRIDSIVLQWNLTSRDIKLVVKKGTAYNDVAQPLDIVRNDSIYELILAYVNVPKGKTSITNADITDKRPDTAKCGYVKGVVDQIDTTNLFAQFTASYTNFLNTWTTERTTYNNDFDAWYTNFKSTKSSDFTTWFDTIKGQLGTDVAGNLQNQINTMSGTLSGLNTAMPNKVNTADMSNKTYGINGLNPTLKELPIASDADTVLDAFVAIEGDNLPDTTLQTHASSWYYLHTAFQGSVSTTSDRVQIAYGATTTNKNIYTRMYYSGAWTAWVKINDGGNADMLDGHHESAFVRTSSYGSIDITSTTYPAPYMISVTNIYTLPTSDMWHVWYIPYSTASQGYSSQIAVRAYGYPDIYFRSSNATSWGIWRRIYNSGNSRPTLIQSATPTDQTALWVY
jgi:hypothetical protein